MDRIADRSLALIQTALSEECGVDVDLVRMQTHLLNDLDIDSLDLLNASCRIETDCGVKLPFRDWLTAEYGEEACQVSPFLVREVCRFLDGALTSAAPLNAKP